MTADEMLRQHKKRGTIIGNLIARAEANGLKHSQLRLLHNYPRIANALLDRDFPTAALIFIQQQT